MLPFTPEVFFAQFEDYNLAIWPAQIIAYALGLLALALAFRPTDSSGRIIGAILASLWLWNGVVYHWLTFATINFAAPLFAALFLVEALLLAWRLVIRGGVAFSFRNDGAGRAGAALMVLAIVIYPLFGALAGHGWPQAAMFGVAPGPTVIFTLGMLLLAEKRVPYGLIVIPLLWSLIGASAVWLLDAPEDVTLLLAGALALVLIARKNRHLS